MIKPLFFFSLIISVAQASPRCKMKSVLDFTIFGVNSVSITNFEIHGSVGAGNLLTVKNSKIESTACRAVTSGGAGFLSGSKISGSVEINGRARIESSEINGDLRSPYQVEMFDSKINLLFSPKKPTGARFSFSQMSQGVPLKSVEPSDLEGDLLQISFENELVNAESKNVRVIPYKEFLTLSLRDKKSYININSRDLEKIQAIEFRGKSDQYLIINVRGTSFKNPGLVLDFASEANPKNVIWNFPEASSIELTDNQSSSEGWAGTVMAPNGTVVVSGSFRGSIFAYNVTFK